MIDAIKKEIESTYEYKVGVKDGREEAIKECVAEIRQEFAECGYVADWLESFMHKNVITEQLNEQKNESAQRAYIF